jgi:hypothetical protein
MWSLTPSTMILLVFTSFLKWVGCCTGSTGSASFPTGNSHNPFSSSSKPIWSVLGMCWCVATTWRSVLGVCYLAILGICAAHYLRSYIGVCLACVGWHVSTYSWNMSGAYHLGSYTFLFLGHFCMHGSLPYSI